MNTPDKAKIEEVIAQLLSIGKPCEGLRIEAENSYYEACLVGTPESYIAAAVCFLRMAHNTDPDADAELKIVFSEEGAVWPVGGMVVEDQDSVALFANRLRSPLPPLSE